MLKLRYIGRGMHLEFCHPEYHTPIVTSRIQEVRESAQPPTRAESTPAATMLGRGTFTKPS